MSKKVPTGAIFFKRIKLYQQLLLRLYAAANAHLLFNSIFELTLITLRLRNVCKSFNADKYFN